MYVNHIKYSTNLKELLVKNTLSQYDSKITVTRKNSYGNHVT